MPFEIVHNVGKGVGQLLGAPDDLCDLLPPQGQSRPLTEASAAHRAAYADYLAETPGLLAAAEEWWEGLVAAQGSLGKGRAQAVEAAYEKRVAGPASLPEFVWFIRAAWLRFDRVNLALPEADRVPPACCLLGWPHEEGREEWVRLVTCMPYWPLGLDAEGRWC